MPAGNTGAQDSWHASEADLPKVCGLDATFQVNGAAALFITCFLLVVREQEAAIHHVGELWLPGHDWSQSGIYRGVSRPCKHPEDLSTPQYNYLICFQTVDMQSSSTILCLLGLSIAVSAAPASQTTGASGSLQLRATRRQAPAPVGKGAESLNSTTQSTNGDDISSQFEGIMTFNGVPYARCFPSRTPAEAERIDIAIIGAPYDLVSRTP